MSDDSEAEIVSKDHSKLLKAVEQLDKTQRVKKAERSEPTLQISEFHLVKSAITDKDAVHVQDLAKSLGQKGFQGNLTKKLRYLQQKTKVLPKPLEKPAAERIKRTIGFENTKKDLQRWNAVIAKNRTTDYLSFPLRHTGKIKESPTAEFLKRFRLKPDLMTKLDEIDKELGLKEEVEEQENPNKNFKVTVKELILKRKEAARQRALQSYREAKASRQRKIKSRKFHRIQRKEMMKQQIKQFKELETTDAQAALEKLDQLDRVRAKERMSLRHRNTGHWAKNKQIQARYNKDIRRELAGQLAINKELTQKVRRAESESEDEDEADELSAIPNNDDDNPWTKTESDVENFIKSYRQYWDKKHKKDAETVAETKQQSNSDEKNNVDNSTSKKTKSKRKCNKSENEDVAEAEHDSHSSKKGKKKDAKKTKEKVTNSKREPKSSAVKSRAQIEKPNLDEEEEEDYVPDLGFTSAKQRVVFDEPLEETTGKESAQNNRSPPNKKNRKIAKDLEEQLTKPARKEAEIDPDKYLNIKPKYLHTQLPDIATGEDEENSEPDEEERHKIMSEAFADDDVVEEFRKEKEEAENKDAPPKLDLKLPGWGRWAGPAIDEEKRQKRGKKNRRSKMIIMNVPKVAPRREENKGNVIVFEHENEKLKRHLVSELPHPFTRVGDFEASLRAPISRTFVAENAHLQLIKPTVTTKIGQVIRPMDENVLVKEQPMVKKRKLGFAAKNDRKNIAKNNKKNTKNAGRRKVKSVQQN